MLFLHKIGLSGATGTGLGGDAAKAIFAQKLRFFRLKLLNRSAFSRGAQYPKNRADKSLPCFLELLAGLEPATC